MASYLALSPLDQQPVRVRVFMDDGRAYDVDVTLTPPTWNAELDRQMVQEIAQLRASPPAPEVLADPESNVNDAGTNLEIPEAAVPVEPTAG